MKMIKKRIRWEVGNVVDKIFKKSLYNSKNEQKIKATVTKLKNKIKKNDIIVCLLYTSRCV